MRNLEKELVLVSATVCEEAIAKAHLRGFVLAFVAKNRQDRWQHLLLHNSKNAHRNSSKLESHLDKSVCSLVSKKLAREQFDLKLTGVYYNFTNYQNEYMLVNLSQALLLGETEDAIFSIDCGTIGFYFSHENRIWLCQKRRSRS